MRESRYAPLGLVGGISRTGDTTTVKENLTVDGDFLLSDTVWDDLKFPATAINPPGQASDPDVEASSGLLLFASSGTELIFALAQMPHAWKEGSEISPHVHWQKTTSAAGNVAWQIRYKIASIAAVMDASWTDLGISTTPVPGTPDINTADYHMITGFDNIDMTGETLSTCILFEVSRVGGDAADTYGADARLLEFDVHYQIDSLGSAEEFSQ